MTENGIKVDESKVETIRTWPTPTNTHGVCSFHGLASFYMWFIQNFSTIMAPMKGVIKGTSFRWTPKGYPTFEEIKAKLTQAPILALPCFDKILKLSATYRCWHSGVVIQEGKPLAFFSEKLCDSRCKYYTNDTKFYAIMRCLKR